MVADLLDYDTHATICILGNCLFAWWEDLQGKQFHVASKKGYRVVDVSELKTQAGLSLPDDVLAVTAVATLNHNDARRFVSTGELPQFCDQKVLQALRPLQPLVAP